LLSFQHEIEEKTTKLNNLQAQEHASSTGLSSLELKLSEFEAKLNKEVEEKVRSVN
jgi:hypothetical protein